MTETPYSICSSALAEVGISAITSFEDGTTQSDVAGNIYERKLTTALSNFPWRFAKKMKALDRLEETPLDLWSYYYQLPSDMVALRTVLADGVPIAYDRHGSKVATDCLGDLVAEYTYRPQEILFPPYFVNALATDLAAHFARAIRRDEDEGRRLDLLANGEIGKPGLWATAMARDSQQQTQPRFSRSRILGVRGARAFGG